MLHEAWPLVLLTGIAIERMYQCEWQTVKQRPSGCHVMGKESRNFQGVVTLSDSTAGANVDNIRHHNANEPPHVVARVHHHPMGVPDQH